MTKRILNEGADFIVADGVIKSSDGSASNPSFTFLNDPDTGYFQPALGEMRFVSNGTAKVEINSTGLQLSAGSRFLITDGTAGAPSVAFSNDLDTGLYLSGSNSMALVANGVDKFRVLAGAVISEDQHRFQTGSAGTPGICFEDDTNTGLYRVTTDQLGLTAGGVLRVKIHANGLEIAQAGTASSPTFFFNSDTDTGIFQPASNELGFTAAGGNKLTIGVNGLQIEPAGTPSLPSLSWNNDDDTGIYSSGSNELSISAGGTKRLHINNAEMQLEVPLDMNSNAINNLPAPTLSHQPARLIDVQTASAGQLPKAPVDLVSTSNITLSGEQTIDGVLTSTSRVLVAGQTNSDDNGIYDTAAGAWTRAVDHDGTPANEIARGNIVLVLSGTDNANRQYIMNATDAADPIAISPGTESQEWIIYSNAEASVAGTGLTKVGLTFSLDTTYTDGRYLRGDTADTAAGEITFSSGALFNDGSAATPSFAFTNDGNTGIYTSGADEFSISTGGSLRLNVTSSRLVSNNRIDVETTNPILTLKDTDSTGNNQIGYISFQDNISAENAWIGYGTTAHDDFNINNALGDITNSISGSVITRVISSGLVINSGQIFVPDGTSSDPSYTFNSDTNTGIYSPLADEMGFTSGGTLQSTVTSTGIRLDSGLIYTQDEGTPQDFNITAGDTTNTSNTIGGAVTISGGNGYRASGSPVQGAGGAVTISGGNQLNTGRGGAVTITSGAGNAVGSGANTSGIMTFSSANGFNSAISGVSGGSTGSVTIQSGAGGSHTAGDASGNASGSVLVRTGAGGNTNSTGTNAAGNASDLTIQTGNGGNATAGTGNGGNAGDILLDAGLGGTTTGGSSGSNGSIINKVGTVNKLIIDTNQITSIDGTGSVPAYSFINDPDTGIYRPTTNEFAISTAGIQGMRIDSSQEIYFPNISTGSSTDLHINTSTGQITANTSSIKYKKNIIDLSNEASEFIYDLRCVHYTEKKTDLEFDGLIAEEVFELAPNYVPLKEGKPDSVSYSRLIVPVIAEMQKTKKENEDLKSKVESLKSELVAIKDYLGL